MVNQKLLAIYAHLPRAHFAPPKVSRAAMNLINNNTELGSTISML